MVVNSLVIGGFLGFCHGPNEVSVETFLKSYVLGVCKLLQAC